MVDVEEQTPRQLEPLAFEAGSGVVVWSCGSVDGGHGWGGGGLRAAMTSGTVPVSERDGVVVRGLGRMRGLGLLDGAVDRRPVHDPEIARKAVEPGWVLPKDTGEDTGIGLIDSTARTSKATGGSYVVPDSVSSPPAPLTPWAGGSAIRLNRVTPQAALLFPLGHVLSSISFVHHGLAVRRSRGGVCVCFPEGRGTAYPHAGEAGTVRIWSTSSRAREFGTGLWAGSSSRTLHGVDGTH